MVLLLHGFCESPAIFDGLLPELSQDFRILRPTLPGHAGLPWDPTLNTISECADWLVRFLDQIGVDSCFLLGHSLGGYIAASVAARHPERLHGICMLHATALDDPPARRVNRDKSLKFIGQYGLEPFLKAFVDSLFYDPGREEAEGGGDEAGSRLPSASRPLEEWKSSLREITSGVDLRAVRALTIAMRDRPSCITALRASGIPTLYVIGEEDGLVSPARSALEFEGWPEVKVARLAGVGHMGMYEAKEDVIGLVRAFFMRFG